MRTDATSSSWDGFEYERVSALQRGVGLTFVDALDLDHVSYILDVGCGDGFLTEKIAERSQADVLGVDSSVAMLARARAREAERLHFEERDANTMAFDQRFDLIVSLNTLHWVLDLPGAFARLFTAQAEGGRLVCQLVGASDVPSIEDVTVAVSQADTWKSHFGADFHPYVHPTQGTLRAVAAAAGYRDVESSAWTGRFAFPSDEHFRKWCAAGMSVWTDRLPEARRAEFIDEVTTMYTTDRGVSREFQFSQVRLSGVRMGL